MRLQYKLTLLLTASLCGGGAWAQTNSGIIRGRVRLAGERPGNPIIRMGMDPKCVQMNAGRRVIQEVVSVDQQGNLANAFVWLEGTFRQTPIPQRPVVIDQRGCIYAPRVVGARVGQVLEVRNDDTVAHNVHGASKTGNDFNITTQARGAPFTFRLKREEFMLRVICDLHKWMVTYVGVVPNPYFAVSGPGGEFEIDKVPPVEVRPPSRGSDEQFGD